MMTKDHEQFANFLRTVEAEKQAAGITDEHMNTLYAAYTRVTHTKAAKHYVTPERFEQFTRTAQTVFTKLDTLFQGANPPRPDLLPHIYFARSTLPDLLHEELTIRQLTTSLEKEGMVPQLAMEELENMRDFVMDRE